MLFPQLKVDATNINSESKTADVILFSTLYVTQQMHDDDRGLLTCTLEPGPSVAVLQSAGQTFVAAAWLAAWLEPDIKSVKQ